MAFGNGTPFINPVAGGPISVYTVTGATNANPIEITVSTNHGLTIGRTDYKVSVQNVGGNTAANVLNNAVTVTGQKTFTLTGVAGNGAYTSGGQVGIQQGSAFNFGGGENKLIFGTVEVINGDGATTTATAEWIDGTATLSWTPSVVYLTRIDATTAANEAAATIIGRPGTITNTGFTITFSAAPAAGKDTKFAFIAL